MLETDTILTIATIVSTIGGAVLVVIKLGARIREYWQKHKSGFWKYALVGVLTYAAAWLSFLLFSGPVATESQKDGVPMTILVDATDGQIQPGMTTVDVALALRNLIDGYRQKTEELDQLRQNAKSGPSEDPSKRAVLLAQIEALNQEVASLRQRALHGKYSIYLETAPENQPLVDQIVFELTNSGFRFGGFNPEPSSKNEIYYFDESKETRQVAADIRAVIQGRQDLAIQFPKAPDLFRDASRPSRDIVVQIQSNLHAKKE